MRDGGSRAAFGYRRFPLTPFLAAFVGGALRGAGDTVSAIVEDRDATPEQRKIDEINSAIYAFDYVALTSALSGLTAHNAQGEYYLTDTVRLLMQEGKKTVVMCVPEWRELLGINTVAQLEEAERIWHEMRGGGR